MKCRECGRDVGSVGGKKGVLEGRRKCEMDEGKCGKDEGCDGWMYGGWEGRWTRRRNEGSVGQMKGVRNG